MRYSGKKKTFTNNTNVYTNTGGVIIGISKSSVGSTGDITLLREDPMPFGKWTESMREDSTHKEDRIRIWADRGYQGTGKDLPGATLMSPLQEIQETQDLDCRAKGAQPPSQLHKGTGGALYRKDSSATRAWQTRTMVP